MNRLEETFKRISDDIRLSEAERSRVREKIIAYQEFKPIRGSAAPAQKKRSPFSMLYYRAPAFAGLAALLLVGSVSYAAEGSVPGDLLYPIKVSINEEVRGAVLLSDESKASWEIARAERRLEEAETLSAQGTLTAALEEEISERFTAHAQEASARIRTLEEQESESAPAVAAELETSLRVHEDVLARVSGKQESRGLAIALRVEVESASRSGKASASAESDTRIMALSAPSEKSEKATPNVSANAARKMKEKAVHEEREAREALERSRPRLSAEALAEADTMLMEAHAAIVRGDEHLAADETGEAFVSYQEGFASLTKLSILLRRGFLSAASSREENPTSVSEDTQKGREEEEEESESASWQLEQGVRHAYRNGTHRFYGKVTLPTPCHLLSTDARTKGDDVTVSFRIEAGEGSCAQTHGSAEFDVSVPGPEDADIRVTLNGEEVSDVKIIEAGPSATSTTSGSGSSVRILQTIL